MALIPTLRGYLGHLAQLRVAKDSAYGQRRRVATVLAGALTLAVGYHIVFGHNGLTAYQQKRQDAQTLAAQVNALKRENDNLRGHVDRLETDPSAIEHQAREELHYTRANEVIVTLPVEAPGSGPKALPSR